MPPRISNAVLVERVENLVKQVEGLVTRIEKIEKRVIDVRLFQAKLIGITIGVSFVVGVLVKVF